MTSALLVMDVQVGIVARFADDAGLVARLRRAIDAAHRASVRVIYVVVGFRDDFAEVSPNNRSFSAIAQNRTFAQGDTDRQVHPDLAPQQGDIVVTKKRVSAFAGSDLDMVLRAQQIDHLVLTGISASGVVLSTVRQAADLDFRLTVLSDGCADNDADVRRVLMDKVFARQADVITIDDWIDSLPAGFVVVRIVVYGAGAVGGVVGARLFEAGHDVVLIARGAHHDAIRDKGLRLVCNDDDVTLRVPVVSHPRELTFTEDDVVILAMKTQHTAGALVDLANAAVASANASAASLSVVCAQNGVENERLALRWFANVYAMCVMCPTGHLEPGVVEAFASPISGLLDVGRYPSGLDDRARAIAKVLETATFRSVPRDDVMRWKYSKLIMNLANAANALCGSSPAIADISARTRAEAEAVLRAAGIDFVSVREDAERRGDLLQVKPNGAGGRGSSTWQSLRRGAGSVETDYLNGEIALLGRRHGVPTPVNELLQRLCSHHADRGLPPGSLDPADLLAQLD